MSHDHSHHHDHVHAHDSVKNIKSALILNVAFTILEIIGGILTNSIAILSDAVHDLGDSISLAASLFMEKISTKKYSKVMTFGYKRYSLLGAFISSVVLIAGSTFILYKAFQRLGNLEDVHAGGMVFMSILGIIFNGLAVLRLEGKSKLNEKVVLMHLLEDLLGWIAVLLVSIVMLFVNLPILDPILSIIITVFVLSRIIPTFIKVSRIFLQYAPDSIEIENIKTNLEGIDGVLNAHDIHLWSLDGSSHIFSCHILVEDAISLDDSLELVNKCRAALVEKGISHSTFEVEKEKSCIACDDEEHEHDHHEHEE